MPCWLTHHLFGHPLLGWCEAIADLARRAGYPSAAAWWRRTGDLCHDLTLPLGGSRDA